MKFGTSSPLEVLAAWYAKFSGQILKTPNRHSSRGPGLFSGGTRRAGRDRLDAKKLPDDSGDATAVSDRGGVNETTLGVARSLQARHCGRHRSPARPRRASGRRAGACCQASLFDRIIDATHVLQCVLEGLYGSRSDHLRSGLCRERHRLLREWIDALTRLGGRFLRDLKFGEAWQEENSGLLELRAAWGFFICRAWNPHRPAWTLS
jgi:hypothetical protein